MFCKKPYYQFVPYRLLKRVQSSVHMRLNDKSLIMPTCRIGSLTCLLWQPGWKTELIRWLLPRKKGAFVDVGAHVGTTLLDFLATQQRGRYIGFEPTPDCIDFLRYILRINRLNNCIIVPAGLFNSNKVLPLYLNPDHPLDSGATLIENLRPGRPVEMQYVPCYRFDDIREAIEIQAISLVKIDVEGGELEVLEGMRTSLAEYRPFVICEVLYADHKANLDSCARRTKALMKLLTDAGYVTFKIQKKSIHGNMDTLIRISSFPVTWYTEENGNECDYLFVPEEEVASIVHSSTYFISEMSANIF